MTINTTNDKDIELTPRELIRLLKKMVDPAIYPMIKKINQFGFVCTELSCQGHYTKKINRSVPISYNKYDMERLEAHVEYSENSHVRYPYIVLKFCSGRVAGYFMWVLRSLWVNSSTESRRHFLFLAARNSTKKYEHTNPTYIVKRFSKKLVSVCHYLPYKKHWQYSKHKPQVNAKIKEIREALSILVVYALKYIDRTCEFTGENKYIVDEKVLKEYNFKLTAR